MPHGGCIRAWAQALGTTPEDVLDFSANLNPLGPPQSVMEALRQHLPEVAWYPEPRGGELKQALAAHLDLPPGMVMVGNGASELIYLLPHVLSPRTTLLPCPTFAEYARAARAQGSHIHYLNMDAGGGFRLPVNDLIAALRRHHHDLLVISNPNNPTGTLVDPGELEALLRAAQAADTWVLVDESFLGFLPEAGRVSVLPRTRLREGQYLARTRELLPAYRASLMASLTSLAPIGVIPSRANFLLCRMANAEASAPLARQLAEERIIIRDCSDFPGLDPSYFRVAVRLPGENQRLANALARVLAKSAAHAPPEVC